MELGLAGYEHEHKVNDRESTGQREAEASVVALAGDRCFGAEAIRVCGFPVFALAAGVCVAFEVAATEVFAAFCWASFLRLKSRTMLAT